MADVWVNAGVDIVTNRIIGVGAEPNFVAWGTGAGTASKGDTTLFIEASEARVSGSSTRETTTTANDTHQVVGTLIADANKTITNAGVFDAVSAGNLYVKGDFAGVTLGTGESIQFTFRLALA